ncbi:hypothetical protein KH5_13690 [Urechidicola sp. KH5]
MPLNQIIEVNITEQCKKNMLSLVLFIALMTPSAVQLLHVFEGHEHMTCNETETHFCKTDLDCSICSFEAFSYNNAVAFTNDYSLNLPILSKIDSYTTVAISSYHHSNKQLRAPPIYS